MPESARIFATSATFVADTNNLRVIRRFSETIKELSTGELMEILGAFKWDHTYEQYKERIYNKTASLFRTAAESGVRTRSTGVGGDHVLRT